MKHVILLAGLTSLIASGASASLVAAWDFQTTTNGGTAAAAAPSSPKVYVANFGSGSLYLNGTNGSSDWFVGASNTEITSFGGTALNADTGIGMSTVTSGTASLALAGGASLGGGAYAANGKFMVFAFSMTNMENLSVSYATQRTSTGFTSQVWEYSVDGTNWFAVTTVSGIQSSFALGTGAVTSLPTVTGLDNAATAFLRVTFSGATSASGNNRLDNIQFNADLIPAPGALAILGVAGLVGARRRRA
ncbi:MAG: hypothetical protein JNK53_04900 [Phycisphaerae bacterium]|nr:hypothetical protein [Phycisphaerae bacterium]